MTEPPANTPNPSNTPGPPSRDPAPLPQVRDLFALYVTCSTAALVVLITAADLDVLLLRSPMAGLVGLLSVVAPLEAVLLGAFTSLLNFYVVRRMPRDSRGGQLEYDGYGGYGYDLTFTSHTSHTGGIRGALQRLLQLLTGQRTSRRLPVVSIVLLLASLPLAAVPHVPPTTPLIGALGSWQGQDQADSTVVLVVPTDAPAASTASTATATALPTAPPTDTTTTNAVPTATARPTATVRVPTATATSTPPPVTFTISPTTFPPGGPWTGCPGTPPPPVSLTLDNTKGAAAVTWQATVETLPSSNTPWATITDAGGIRVTGGMVPAGKSQPITVTPDPSLCQASHNGKSWLISVVATNAGTTSTSTSTFTYMVS